MSRLADVGVQIDSITRDESPPNVLV